MFDVGADGRTLTGRRPFVTIEAGIGWPDGLAVDASGGVWVALFGGSAVRGYAPEGTLATVIHVDTPHVTACAFVGDDLGTLCITTSQEDIDVRAEPLAGTLFAVRPGATGMLPLPFLGDEGWRDAPARAVRSATPPPGTYGSSPRPFSSTSWWSCDSPVAKPACDRAR